MRESLGPGNHPALWEPPGRLLESLGATTWEVPGVPASHLRAIRESLGSTLGAAWEPLGATWEAPEAPGSHLGEPPGGSTWSAWSYLGATPGAWELPGGKVEPGEQPDQALARELHEELGVTLESAAPLTFSWHAYPERTVLILFYAVALSHESPPPTARVAKELRLLNREELLTLEMPPANAPFMRWLENQLP